MLDICSGTSTAPSVNIGMDYYNNFYAILGQKEVYNALGSTYNRIRRNEYISFYAAQMETAAATVLQNAAESRERVYEGARQSSMLLNGVKDSGSKILNDARESGEEVINEAVKVASDIFETTRNNPRFQSTAKAVQTILDSYILQRKEMKASKSEETNFGLSSSLRTAREILDEQVITIFTLIQKMIKTIIASEAEETAVPENKQKEPAISESKPTEADPKPEASPAKTAKPDTSTSKATAVHDRASEISVDKTPENNVTKIETSTAEDNPFKVLKNPVQTPSVMEIPKKSEDQSSSNQLQSSKAATVVKTTEEVKSANGFKLAASPVAEVKVNPRPSAKIKITPLPDPEENSQKTFSSEVVMSPKILPEEEGKKKSRKLQFKKFNL